MTKYNLSDCAIYDLGEDFAPDDICSPADEWNPPHLCTKHQMLLSLKGADDDAILGALERIVVLEKNLQDTSQNLRYEIETSASHIAYAKGLEESLNKLLDSIKAEVDRYHAGLNVSDLLDAVTESCDEIGRTLEPEEGSD